jgi:nucleotide-binding universal stress UspA family protein
MRHPIVCGIDGSNESRLAARVAAELARALGRGLVLAHATDDPPTFPYGDARLRELQRRSATHAATRLLDDVAAELPTIGLETRIMFGDPGEALKSLCHDSDAALLVLGSTGRSGLAAGLHGSLSARLASTGECPVVAVSPDAAERFLRAQHSGDAVVRGVGDAGESTRALQVASELATAA